MSDSPPEPRCIVAKPTDEVVTRELGLGENLLWAGRPPRSIIFRGNEFWMIPIGLVLILFGVAALIASANQHGPGTYLAIPFLLVPLLMGFYFAFGRLLLDTYIRRGMHYAVTSERVVIVYRWFGTFRIQYHTLRLLSEVRFVEFRSGGGRIELDPQPPWMYAAFPAQFGSVVATELVLADDARQVYEIIRDAQRLALRSDRPSDGLP